MKKITLIFASLSILLCAPATATETPAASTDGIRKEIKHDAKLTKKHIKREAKDVKKDVKKKAKKTKKGFKKFGRSIDRAF